MTDVVTVEDTDGIRVLTINRPSRRNALNAAAYYALARRLEARWPAAGWLLGSPHAPIYPTRGV